MSRREARKGGVTAEEFMAELEADSEWVADRDERDRERRQRVERNLRDEAPLRAALAEQDFEVDSVADLYNRRMNYEAVIPTLMEWFPRIENPAVKESVARALTVRWARPEAAPMMLAELRRLDGSDEDRSLRFAVANALSEVADDSVFDQVVELARDRAYPIADRGILVLALAKMEKEREGAIEVLRDLLSDEVAPHAVTALGELRATEARAEIELFLRHDESWVRQEAKKALRKLDTAEARRS